MEPIQSVFVTGIWSKAIAPDQIEKLSEKIEQSFEMLEGQTLIAFYDRPWVVDFFRHIAFDFDINLATLPLHEDDLPAERYVDAFMKRFLSYAVSQRSSKQDSPIEKSWQLYWKQYLVLGEEGFRTWLSAKLSKIDLVAKLLPQMSNIQSERQTWIDPDFADSIESTDDLGFILGADDPRSLNYFPSHFNYLGKPLAVGSYCLGANANTWQRISKVYNDQVERLGYFPYGYDEEVVLSLAKAQHAHAFNDFYDAQDDLHEVELMRFQA